MKTTILSLFMFLVVLSGLAIGQSNAESTTAKFDDCDSVNKLITSAEKWRRVNLIYFSMCIPPDLKAIERRCIEGGCYKFESDQITLTIDSSTAVWRPTFQRGYPSYRETFSTIDGEEAWIWYWEGDGVYKGISGVNFKSKKSGRYDFGVFFFNKEAGKHDLATKMFESIRFDQPPAPPEDEVGLNWWRNDPVFDYKGWQKIEMKTISFYLPPDFKRIERKCIDSDCARFENGTAVLNVDSTLAAGYPASSQIQAPGFREARFWSGEDGVWVWRYNEDQKTVERPFVAGALFTRETHKKKRAGVYFSSKIPYDRELVRNIFRSVKIK